MSMVLYLRAVDPKPPETYRSLMSDPAGFMFSTEPKSDLIDFDVEWMAMNYLIQRSGDMKKLSRMILFGEGAAPVSENLGYGSAYYVGPTHVADFAKGLSQISSEDLKRNFNAQDMVDNYVGHYFTGNADKDWQGLIGRIDNLRSFMETFKFGQRAIIGLVA